MKTVILPTTTALLFLPFVAFVSGCGDNQDPAGASELWNRIHEGDYRSMPRAPGYESRRPTNAPHGDQVDIYIDEGTKSAFDAKRPITEWPVGTLIVKDGWDEGDLEIVAVMEKRANGWYWAEYDKEGNAKYSGKPSLCIDCHASGADSVRAFGFPK
jgi:hypothetical protein